MAIFQKYINPNANISASFVQAGDLHIEQVGTAQEPTPVLWGWPAECKLFLSKINFFL